MENQILIKKFAILINTAGGEIVDEKILIPMLKNKKIFGIRYIILSKCFKTYC